MTLRAHQAATAGSLGHDARAEFHLCPSESHHQATRSEHDLHLRARPWRPGVVANAYLEGTYSEVYPDMTQDEAGMKRLFRQFSFPGGIPSHVAPETPGSIHEGGELGYSLSHAYGAAFDNPDLDRGLRRRRRRSRNRPAGRLAGIRTNFSIPSRDGAVLPILHLNGYKIANPTVLARISHDELNSLFVGYGYEPYYVEGARARADAPVDGGDAGRGDGGDQSDSGRGPQAADDGKERPSVRVADDRSAHPQGLDRSQGGRRTRKPKAPGARTRCRWPRWPPNPAHIKLLEAWMKSYQPEELFDADGTLEAGTGRARAHRTPPDGSQSACQRRTAAQRSYDCPISGIMPSTCPTPGTVDGRSHAGSGSVPARCDEAEHAQARTFASWRPTRLTSNRLGAVLEVTDRAWMAEREPDDDHLARMDASWRF